jgi:hypothetical protein
MWNKQIENVTTRFEIYYFRIVEANKRERPIIEQNVVVLFCDQNCGFAAKKLNYRIAR